jgi:nucleoside-diphosphate-sugar epimerase
MGALKVLFVGGGGMISSACAHEAVARGLDLSVLTRQKTSSRPLPEAATLLRADARDPAAVRDAVGDSEFDVVVNFIGYSPKDVQADVDLFNGRIGQYVFISTTSVYHRPIAQLPIVESTPRRNNAWPYPKDKIACEELLERSYREQDFPATIVRPCHTYDGRTLPMHGGWTVVERMRQGKPVVVHGDGTSLWALTHHRDFARGFVPLLGNPHTIGDSVHLTTDEILTWDQIHRVVAAAAGVRDPVLVHRSSETIAEELPDWGPSLTDDFAHSLVFDNTKLRRLVPGFTATTSFAEGVREVVDWYDADPARRHVSSKVDEAFDRLIAR